MLSITSFYAGCLGILYLGLSFNVIRNRWKFRQSLGSGSEAQLEKSIRIHGNFSEYVPLIVIMMALLELNKESVNLLHSFGIMLIVGRLLHAYGIAIKKVPNPYRIIGMSLTFICMIGSSIKLIFSALNNGF
ncbi:MAG: MAPEG family protein [Bdellovibrionota bacterium]|jgi:uncharacterized membrane protein YecN with MAPEG domain|nr:MAPEG family protein [Bdellovibrionota bacterium]